MGGNLARAERDGGAVHRQLPVLHLYGAEPQRDFDIFHVAAFVLGFDPQGEACGLFRAPKQAVRNTCQEPQGVLAAHVEFDVLVSCCRGFAGGGHVDGMSRAEGVHNVLPALVNEMIVLIKETAIIGYIGEQDLTKAAMVIQSRTFEAFIPLITAAVIYLALVMLLTFFMNKLERRLRTNER